MKLPFDSWGFRAIFSASALAAALCFLGPVPLRADDDDCQRRIARADHRLHEAAEHHGWDSPQAAKYRHQLREARAWCWEHRHRWWDEDGHRWRSDRDWDDHDHDRH